MGAMMGVLLHVEEHREHAWEHLLWLLHQYREVWDPSGVTVSLGYFLGAVADIQTRVPRARHLAIATAVHQQLCDEMEPPSPEHRAELCRCMVLQARICPEETIEFLYYKLRNGSKADRVAAVAVLQALVRSDAPDTRDKLTLFAKLVQSVCHDPAAQVSWFGQGWCCHRGTAALFPGRAWRGHSHRPRQGPGLEAAGGQGVRAAAARPSQKGCSTAKAAPLGFGPGRDCSLP
ncbi:uncharacterized protein LOC135328189 [Dromaius novaehollandiae]|uniref:uncharacterized protein LOC135328189 n=1 Tax=Dromaius novaehollandiae TaxID=8790 RepID=UPI00311FECA1